MLFEDRLIVSREVASGNIYGVVVNPTLPKNGDSVEVLVDNNFFARVVQGKEAYLSLVELFRDSQYVINPIAAALEQVASNKDEYPKKYLAFRRNCAYGQSFEDLPLGGKERLWIGLSQPTYFLEILVLRCYVLFFAIRLADRKKRQNAIPDLKRFLEDQPVRHVIIGVLFMLCAHVLNHESNFREADELPLIAKFFKLPDQRDDKSIQNWARNRAADLYTIIASSKVLRGDTPFSDVPPKFVVVATSDNFVAKVLLRYCCTSASENGLFSIDQNQLMLLDPKRWSYCRKLTMHGHKVVTGWRIEAVLQTFTSLCGPS